MEVNQNIASQKQSIYRRLCGAATPETAKKPFGMVDLSAYAAGDFACNMSFFLNSYLMLFWTQYLGLDKSIWAIVIIILKIWDAFNDPLVGALMDGRKPRSGISKFKPWIFWGSFALIFSAVLCFLPIKGAPTWLLVIILIIGYLSWDTFYTVVNVPYGSMNAVISSKVTEKAQLSTYRSVGSALAQIISAAVIPFIIFEGNTIRGEYMIWVAFVAGIIGLIGFFYFLWGTTERVNLEFHQDLENKEKENSGILKVIKNSTIGFLNVFKDFLKNKPAIILTIVSLVQLVAVLGFQLLCMTVIFQQIFPELTKFSGIFGLVSVIPTLTMTPLVKKLVGKFGKKEIACWTLPITIVGAIMIGVLPLKMWTGQGQVALAVSLLSIGNLIVGFGSAFLNLLTWSMVADCIDYQEIKTGVRAEGSIYAIYSLGRKIGQAIAAAVPVLILSAITGYVGYDDPSKEAASVGMGTLWVYAGALGIGYTLVFIILLFFYGLNKKQVLDMEKTLNRSNLDLIGGNQDE